MLSSRCCRDDLYIHYGQADSSFYICRCCDKACDTILLYDKDGDESHDARNDDEVKAVAGYA